MLVRVSEAPLVRLPVDSEEGLADLAEDADGSGTTADVRPRPPFGGDRASEHDAVLHPAAGITDPACGGVLAVDGDDSLDRGLARSRPYEGAVPTSTEEQEQPAHHHGLAGTGLTGDDVQPGMQGKGRLLDDTEPADPDLSEHSSAPGLASRARTGRTSPRVGR